MRHFIVLGGPEHERFFRLNPEYTNNGWLWTVPKSAEVGDIGFTYLTQPVSRIVGAFTVSKVPFYNIDVVPRLANRWMAEITDVRNFPNATSMSIGSLRRLFPDWPWLRYPRGHSFIADDIAQSLLELGETILEETI